MIERDITIRRGTDSDAETLTRFNIAMAHETENLELRYDVVLTGVHYLLSHPEYGFYVVTELGGVVVGSLMVTAEWSDWRDGFFWWLQSVYIRPDFRRKGIYRSLYEQVKAMAAGQRNVCGFRLYVERENKTAQTTYDSLGMRETYYKIFEEMVRLRAYP